MVIDKNLLTGRSCRLPLSPNSQHPDDKANNAGNAQEAKRVGVKRVLHVKHSRKQDACENETQSEQEQDLALHGGKLAGTMPGLAIGRLLAMALRSLSRAGL
jgi:hypothetical protein